MKPIVKLASVLNKAVKSARVMTKPKIDACIPDSTRDFPVGYKKDFYKLAFILICNPDRENLSYDDEFATAEVIYYKHKELKESDVNATLHDALRHVIDDNMMTVQQEADKVVREEGQKPQLVTIELPSNNTLH